MKKILTTILVIVILLVALAAAGLAFLTVNEYNPADLEDVVNYGTSSKQITAGDSLTVLTYNIGYGANDAEHDFFMDGGNTVTTESSDNISKNMDGIIDTVYSAGADVNFLQEVDRGSKRSYDIDEANLFANTFTDTKFAFGTNFLCSYIPYPFPDNIGKVNSGIMTVCPYEAETVQRVALTTPFSWPVRTCQLKRCLLVEKIPLVDSSKNLVLVNLHLEAYDSGEGKIEQYKELCEYIKLEYANGNYVIAGGDFNATLPSVDSSKYPLNITDHFVPASIDTSMLTGGWKYCTDDSVPTSRLLNEPYDPDSENTQYYCIDGFICSPNVLVDSVTTIDTQFAYSDHNPVMAKFTLVK